MRSAWKPPIELARTRPRPVRLTGAGRAVAWTAILLAAGSIGGSIGLYFLAERSSLRRERIRTEAVAVQAQVVELTHRRGEGGGRYLVSYRYNAGDRPHQATSRIARGRWNALRAGSAIEVRYLPSRPGESWLPEREPRVVPMWVAVLVPACLLPLAWLCVKALRDQWSLVSEGRPALARVLRSERVQHTHGAGGHVVHYEFTLLTGAIRKGKCGVAKNAPVVGSTLVIVYDSDEPKRNARYPFSLVRLT